MDERNEQKNRNETDEGGNWLSFLLVMLALAALIVTCKYCYPQFGSGVETFLHDTGGKIAEAFSETAEHLGRGEDVVSAFRETSEILKHDAA